MKLTRLRIVGFKTFVEPTDILIEPGLTGVVGPNGCGKSNLVEALRWVMGESSHKNMRATGMDEVIFGGSTTRPARNTAEVTLAIDNADHTAPAAFNAFDELQISRRIERQQGSSYHVNGREVRARDVQLLFADAATGARSPALVRQGQISELIAAKPQARRRILEDAAGIAGLHARRHEAELRLKHAEENLLRVEDVLGEITLQAEALRRQGRQASRYRALSAEIRKLEARASAAAWREAEAERQAAEAAQRQEVRTVAERTAEQAEAAREQGVAAHAVAPLREAEIVAAATLRRLVQARTDLDHEERRAAERLTELKGRVAELERDEQRQGQIGHDAAETIARLGREAVELSDALESAADRESALRDDLGRREASLAVAETAFGAVQAELAELAALRAALERERTTERDRRDRAGREVERLRREAAALEASRSGGDTAGLRQALEAAERGTEAAEAAAASDRTALARLREEDARERAATTLAVRASERLDTELRTLAKLLTPAATARFATILDRVTVEPGFEHALAAALGDDLDASPDAAAPLRWTENPARSGDPDLPAGTLPLSAHVEGPVAMTRRLRQIGLVARERGSALAGQLRVGQRLVSREGDLWRWDGLSAAAEAPSPAARRLAERNRLAGLERDAAESRGKADTARTKAEAAERAAREGATAESAALDAARRARQGRDSAREALGRAERRDGETTARLSALTEAILRVETTARDSRVRDEEAARLLADLADPAETERRHLEARAEAAEARVAAAEARTALAVVTREAESANRRRAALADDIRTWTDRAGRAATAASEIAGRLAAAAAERGALAAAPDTFILRRRALQSEIASAETARSEAADSLAGQERAVQEADRASRSALEALAAARERRAAADARADALLRRTAELRRQIAETFDTDPPGLLAIAGLKPGEPFDPAATEARLLSLKADRERLGGVNLRAEEELAEAQGKHARLAAERDDLVEAIKRLRQAISNLNREGRERLRAAFVTVDAHFRRLFTTLFGGGEAELSLVDSDDPLEAGLDILARPPGKKPQSLSLLSGGEQALTATALIFAVFLTNPSPICVLDEVDAPLDDANVERYCDLLHEMARETDTRFIVITHNPITMARMDRLFGVTMAERGISQLVTVDLEAAERMREAV